MSRKVIALLLIGLATVLLWYSTRTVPGTAAKDHLQVFCAANLKKPVEALAAQYREETGVEVQLQYGGTGALLSQLQVAGKGDIFIAADDGSLEVARGKKLVQEVLPIAVQHPVVAVAKGNPKQVRSLADLMKPDIKVALASPDAASISKIARKLLGAQWAALAAKAAVMKTTVTEIAADAQLGAVDAAVVWDATIPQFDKLEGVELPEFAKHRENASAAILTSCAQPAQALRFARYLSAPEKGGKTFASSGFQPAGGDKWSLKPELVFYSGGVNRPAVENVVQQFADREGINVTTVFNGCGILCAAMKTMGDSTNPKFPDVYYACDVCFVPPVAQHFPEAVMLTETEIVIAVPKGNPKHIKTLADLARPGLRVGLCNAEQSTLGFMTQAILKSMNLHDSVMKNASSQVPTADFLVNQMRAGALDAAVVYRVNVDHQKQHFDAIPLPEDKARAVQPFAVRTDSPHKHLGRRMLAFLRAHRDAFEEVGFVWRGDAEAVKSADIVLPEWLKPAQN